MGFWNSLLSIMQYAPLVMEVSRAMNPKPEDAPVPEVSQQDLQKYKQTVDNRLDAMDDQLTHLRERVRVTEQALIAVLLWVRVGLVSLGVLVVILLIAVLTRH